MKNFFASNFPNSDFRNVIPRTSFFFQDFTSPQRIFLKRRKKLVDKISGKRKVEKQKSENFGRSKK